MRPVNHTTKTAFIFYLIYAALIIGVALWIPRSGLFSHKFDGIKQSPSRSLTRQLHLKQQIYRESWQKILVQEGYIPKAVYRIKGHKRLTRKVGKERIQWIFYTNTIVLPRAANKNSLVTLAFKWKKLVQSLGLTVHSAKWGYTNGLLWVKLASSYPMGQGKKYSPSLPLEYLTLVQPLTGFKGRIPGLIPELPPIQPDLSPAAAPKPSPSASSVQGRPEIPRIQKNARLAIIIDDVGYDAEAAEAMLKVPAPLTFSVLPFGPCSRKYAEAAKVHGFGVMLHLPLEPVNPNINPGPGAIKRSFSEEEVADQLEKDLEQVPEAIGINNHEGSAGTSDPRLMGILMKEIKKRQLFFVDSMTIGTSVAAKYARLTQIPSAKR